MSLRVATIQYRSQDTPEANVALAYHLAKHVSLERPDIIVLPEYTFFYGQPETFKRFAWSFDIHPWTALLKKWATEFKAVVIAGSVPEPAPALFDETIFHTAMIASPDTTPNLSLQKQKLFYGFRNTHLTKESDTVARGSSSFLTFSFKGWRIGMAVGLALRYSKVFHALRYEHQCDLVVAPAAFFGQPNHLNWLSLLQSRAYEFQIYVASANQCATPHEDLPLFCGQSAIISPEGSPLSLANTLGEAVCLQDLDKDVLIKTRIAFDARFNIDKSDTYL